MTTDAKRRVLVNDAVIFDLLMLAIFLVFVVGSFRYNARAQSIPLAVGLVGVVMIAFQLVADAVPAARGRLRFVTQRGLLGKAESARPGVKAAGAPAKAEAPEKAKAKSEPSWASVFRIVLWLFGFTALLAWTNYLLAVGLFTFFITLVEAKVPWTRAFLLAAAVNGSFYVLFEVILGAHL